MNEFQGATNFPPLIRRLHLFEIHDQTWCPPFVRKALTSWLRALWEYGEAEEVLAPILARVIRSSGADQIVDLCSGGSGPMVPLQRKLTSLGLDLPVILTDKFPDPQVKAEIGKNGNSRITTEIQSIDARALPENLKGFRTLFNSFHHFTPPEAHAILADAHHSRQPIGIFEVSDRSTARVLLSFPASFFAVFLLIARMRPRRISWWFFTWIIPVIPLVVGWDGFVSHLRTYSREEFRELTKDLTESYTWENGYVETAKGVKINFLLGVPLNGQPLLPAQ